MWVIGKIRESMESIPLELRRYMGNSEEEIRLPSKTSPSDVLPDNILTPDKIPDFSLPPRLCKRNLTQEAKTRASGISSNAMYGKIKKECEAAVAVVVTTKPLPFSAEAYGLAGVSGCPNTRRKESLFHSKCPAYVFDRDTPSAPLKLSEERSQLKKTLPGFLPSFLCKSLSESGGTEIGKPSSRDSSPCSTKSSNYNGHLKGAISCPSLIDNREDKGKFKRKIGVVGLTSSSSSPQNLDKSFPPFTHHVSLPVLGQETLQREHVLSLHGRGKVHLLAEITKPSTNSNSYLSTLRIRVMSVVGIHNDKDPHVIKCALILCLTPGMLQQQESATIRNSHSPVFDEDFFFDELSEEDLMELQLRIKVVGKPAAAAQQRGVVIGVIKKPLSQLVHLKQLRQVNY